MRIVIIFCFVGGHVDEGLMMVAPSNDDETEIIRCVCNLYCDEGLMIQCDRCGVLLLLEYLTVILSLARHLCAHLRY